MTREIVLLIFFAALMSAAPYWFLSPRRRAFARSDIATWVALGGLLASASALGIHLAPSLALAIVIAAKLAHFFAWLTLVPTDEIRWSARAAALFSLALYLIVGSAVLASPIDGDEPYHVLIAESILHDGDVDLENQYAALERSAANRPDLPKPFGAVGPRGVFYARHEPFLPLLLVPGVALGGLWGAMATMAVLGSLGCGSILRLAEESGASRRALVRVWPLVALAPPYLFFAVRIWSEAPAALCLSEAIRAAGSRRWARFAAWILALSFLQLRFGAIAAAFVLAFVVFEPRARKFALAAAAVLILPLVLGWLLVGNPLLGHRWSELAPAPLWKYARGGLGLLFDAQAGMLLQAPIWFASIGAWFLVPGSGAWARAAAPERGHTGIESRGLSLALRAAAVAVIPYLILLAPREEWHGGWSPPLRYLVVFTPLIAVGAARLFETPRPWIVLAAFATALIAVHGIAFPLRLFHIANGEAVLGEWLSLRFGSDFSRLFPSFIRPNSAAWAIAIVLVVVLAMKAAPGLRHRLFARRLDPRALSIAVAAAIVLFLGAGRRPGNVVHFEDAHVTHRGGLLDPDPFTVARFRFTGGWRLGDGESIAFRMRPGPATLFVRAEHGGTFEIDGRAHEVPATGATFIAIPTSVPAEEAVIRVTRGALTFDRVVRGK